MIKRSEMFLCMALAFVLTAGCVASTPTKAPVLPAVQAGGVGSDQLTGAGPDGSGCPGSCSGGRLA